MPVRAASSISLTTILAIGLFQGIVLYLLFNALQDKTWPATEPALFAPLCAAAVFLPRIIVAGLANLRLRELAIWSSAVALICLGLARYDIDRDPVDTTTLGTGTILRNLPSLQLWYGLSLVLFITHCLLTAAVADRRLVAHYPTYCALAWKYGLQAAMAALFAGLFWGVLWLVADLFKLIKIDFFAELIRKSWIAIPATTVALTCALHVTDVRAGIVRGVRTVACNLLAWLLPLLALIAVGFVAALPFTGLAPLWDSALAAQQTLPLAAQKSAEALEKTNRSEYTPPISNATRAANITVAQPPGTSLPREFFLETTWNKEPRNFLLPRCLTANDKCDAVLVDLDGDGIAEIILQPHSGQATVFHSADGHAGSYLGTLAGSNCPASTTL